MANLRTSNLDKTLKLTRGQYRQLAEISKSAGLGLNLSSEKKMKGWGEYSPWGLLVCKDVTSSEPGYHERALMTLASTVDTRDFRAAGASRPELDWSVLANDEIYPFIVWHEVGHRTDNFCLLDVATIKDVEIRNQCTRHARFIDEVLADRFAWEKLRPGEPIPLTEQGKEAQERIAESMALLDSHLPRLGPAKKPLASGQYRDVPEYMLATAERAGYVGPRVHTALLRERVSYHRKYEQTGRRPLYLTGVPWRMSM